MKIRLFNYLIVTIFILSSCIKTFKYTTYEKNIAVDNGQTFLEKENGEKIYGGKVKYEKVDNDDAGVMTETSTMSIDGNKYFF